MKLPIRSDMSQNACLTMSAIHTQSAYFKFKMDEPVRVALRLVLVVLVESNVTIFVVHGNIEINK
jgi:hypothetical protein